MGFESVTPEQLRHCLGVLPDRCDDQIRSPVIFLHARPHHFAGGAVENGTPREHTMEIGQRFADADPGRIRAGIRESFSRGGRFVS